MKVKTAQAALHFDQGKKPTLLKSCSNAIIPGGSMDAPELWKRYRQYLCRVDSLDLSLDISRMHFDESYLASKEPAIQSAFTDMAALESGAIANPDEKRMVGHYWLRAPILAPTKEIAQEIMDTVASIKRFAADVHAGKIKPQRAERFTQVLAIGIGGSALGPMFVSDALGNPGADRMRAHFIDNTDPTASLAVCWNRWADFFPKRLSL